jgi:hypothetical protein
MNTLDNEHTLVVENEAVILRLAMEALKALVPLEYELEPVCGPRELGYDFIVQATVFGKGLRWYVQVKKRLNKLVELHAIQKNEVPHQFLLATEYVPPEAAIRLHNNSIQFIDTVGNAFINQPPVFIFVKGNKPEKEKAAPPVGRLFKGVGLKIVYLLLCRPEHTERPYRMLAEMTDVALGTVNGTMTELIRRGFILDMGDKGKKLFYKKTLFERWVVTYPDYLKPKMLLGRFRGADDWWKEVQLDPAIAQWGGEVAAAKLTGYLKPGTVTLYVDKNRLADLVITSRLRKDPQGNVEILERFWPPGDYFGECNTVHPILIYADLAAIGEQRTMETARMIYEKYLDRYFGED